MSQIINGEKCRVVHDTAVLENIDCQNNDACAPSFDSVRSGQFSNQPGTTTRDKLLCNAKVSMTRKKEESLAMQDTSETESGCGEGVQKHLTASTFLSATRDSVRGGTSSVDSRYSVCSAASSVVSSTQDTDAAAENGTFHLHRVSSSSSSSGSVVSIYESECNGPVDKDEKCVAEGTNSKMRLLITRPEKEGSTPVVEDAKGRGSHQRKNSQSLTLRVVNHVRTNSSTDTPAMASDCIVGERYHIFDLIGSGAFAQVKRGLDAKERLPVAVKMIDKAVLKKSETLRLAVGREIEVMKSLQGSPGIVQLLDVVDAPAQLCLVLEYVPGGELFDLIADYRDYLDEHQCRRIFRELVEAVDFMHKLHICHRDIKVENVLLTCKPPLKFCSKKSVGNGDRESSLSQGHEPHVKLADFGLARHFDAGELLTTRCGSEEYTAPEIILGNEYDGTKTDVWSLGCILYAMIVGHLPFEAESKRGGRRAMIWRIIKAEIKWPEVREPSPPTPPAIQTELDAIRPSQFDKHKASEHVQRVPSNANDSVTQVKVPSGVRAISNSVKLLVAKMIAKVENRYSTGEILKDPWMTEASAL